MLASRRRIVRRALMALAVVVLLPVGYVGSAMVVTFAAAAGWITPQFLAQESLITIVYEPLNEYIKADLPGGRLITQMGRTADGLGRSLR
jgi:hypothetical protein